MKLAAVFLAPLFGVAVMHCAETPLLVDAAQCGPYPFNYKEIVTHWLNKELVDAASARIEWEGEPEAADLGKKGQHLYGWLVRFKVNARNVFGAPTGLQRHAALIRDGEVIKGVGF